MVYSVMKIKKKPGSFWAGFLFLIGINYSKSSSDFNFCSYFFTASFTSWYETTMRTGQLNIHNIGVVYIFYNFKLKIIN